MYRLVILGVAAFTTLVAGLDPRECFRLFHPQSVHCCKRNEEKEKAMTDGLQECFQLPKEPRKCEYDLCIAQKKGFATDDGKLDPKKLEKIMNAEIDDKDLMEDLKKYCFEREEDLAKYGPPDACDFVKMRHCSSLHILNHCSEWNDFRDCNDLKEIVAECVKIIV